MLPGFNHNVRRRGRVYHVQTEDLGATRAVVVTHLFSGGNVVASSRTEYRDLLGAADVEERVRAAMQNQHKDMLRKLASGAYDEEDAAP